MWPSPLSHPHGDADGTVHVAFIQPTMFGDPAFLGSQGGRVLQKTKTQEETISNTPMLYSTARNKKSQQVM